MRTYARPIPDIDTPADTVGAVIVSTALAVVSNDWPSGAKVARFAGSIGYYVNAFTTGASVPSTAQSGSTSSTGRSVYQPPETPRTLQIPGDSTGYSITSPSSGVITAEFWSK